MQEAASYLLQHYYPRYREVQPDMVPDNDVLVDLLIKHQDKLIIVAENGKISGIAIYLKLDDETYNNIESYDMRRVDVLSYLLNREGDNYHFILLTAKGIKAIRRGIEAVKKLKPKTISWWNPGMTKVHHYKVK